MEDMSVYQYIHVARITFETKSPLSIGTGQTDGIFDTQLVRDANGLPCIPGTTLAGVLRAGYLAMTRSDIETDQLFGCAAKNHDEAQASLVSVSFASIHDANNHICCTLLLKDSDKLETDPILKNALDENPITRQSVAIDHKGTTKNTGLFDRTSLNTGYRFTFEISLCSQISEDKRWEQLLNLCHQTEFRLGAATRRGLGKVKVLSIQKCTFDLMNCDKNKKAHGFVGFSALSIDLNKNNAFAEHTIKDTCSTEQIMITNLVPIDLYRFGQGLVSLKTDAKDTADIFPVTEQIVEWSNNKATISQPKLLIPATGIKGALSHRVAFHYNVLKGNFADLIDEEDFAPDAPNKAVIYWFGDKKNEIDNVKGKTISTGHRGRLIFDDIYPDFSTDNIVQIYHNGIDRFTGGVREHVLFSEEVCYNTPGVNFIITLSHLPFDNDDDELDDFKQALKLAIKDLVEGRLSMGSGRGSGYFKADAYQWTQTKSTGAPV